MKRTEVGLYVGTLLIPKGKLRRRRRRTTAVTSSMYSCHTHFLRGQWERTGQQEVSIVFLVVLFTQER